MFSLALETSGRLGSIALFRDGTLLDERTYPHGLQHAAAIVPMLDALCREHSIAPKQLEEIYLSIGPGSFTGLRVGVTLAKTLAFSTGAKIVAVPSVEVIVENLPAEAKNGIIVLDAKRGQIFTARFARAAKREVAHDDSNAWTCVQPARLDTLAASLAASPRPVHLIGEGIPYHRAAIPDSSDVIIANESLWLPRASIVGRLGYALARQSKFTDPFHLVPTYIRLAEAEEKRLILEGKLDARIDRTS